MDKSRSRVSADTIPIRESISLDRRRVSKLIGAAAVASALAPSLLVSHTMAQEAGTASGSSGHYPFELPPLPYEYGALQAVIDEQTMQIHYGKHHRGYTDKLNGALKDLPTLHGSGIEELLGNLDGIPEPARVGVRNNGGGYYNHLLFWSMMSPAGGGQPAGELGKAIARDFGDLAAFRGQFSQAAGSVFGSGWAWLVKDADGKLSVIQTANQDSPISLGRVAVLGIDVWEHAYYLRYQNRRSDYIENFWRIVNWDFCASRYTL